MAKKDFGNIGKNNQNLTGGGISNLIPESNEATEEVRGNDTDTESPKTFYLLESDHKFLGDYSRFMAFHHDSKYPLKTAIHDAIQLLREKYPDVGKK